MVRYFTDQVFEEQMTKAELVQLLAADNPTLYVKDVERAVSTIFDKISNALANGDRVEIRGFGAFTTKTRTARIGRNPRTGISVQVSEKSLPAFRASKLLQGRLNGRA